MADADINNPPMGRNGAAQRLVWVMGLAWALSGCASAPSVGWQPDAEPAGVLNSMETALRNADSLEAALRKKSAQHADARDGANRVIQGAGLAAVAATAFKAHSDVYRVLALVGGGAYISSTFNYDPARYEAYQSGLRQVRCAREITRPLQISRDELAGMARDGTRLAATLDRLAAAIARAKALLTTETLPATVSKQLADSINEANATLVRSQATLAQGGRAPAIVSQGASRLKTTLGAISDDVDARVSQTIPPPGEVLNALKKELAQLAKSMTLDLPAGLFAVDVEGATTANANRAKSRGAPPAPPSSAVTQALVELASAQAATQSQLGPLELRLPADMDEKTVAALKECGVVDAMTALKVSPAELKFTSAADDTQTREVAVSGATGRYVTRLGEDASARGIFARHNLGDRTVYVVVPKGVTGTFEISLGIYDIAEPQTVKTVAVKVAPAVKAADEPAVPRVITSVPPVSSTVIAADLLRVQASLAKLVADKTASFTPSKSSVTYTVTGSQPMADTQLLTVTLTCDPAAPARKDTVSVVRGALMARAAASGALGKVHGSVPQRVQLAAVDGCLQR